MSETRFDRGYFVLWSDSTEAGGWRDWMRGFDTADEALACQQEQEYGKGFLAYVKRFGE